MSEAVLGKVLRRKVFDAPADSPNKRTFFYCGMVSIISKKGSGNGVEKLTGFPPNAAICD